MAKKKATRRKKKKTAKKGAINKSQAIRDYLAKHPNAGPKEAAEELSKQGIKVSPTLVSGVKARSGGMKKRRKKSRRKANKASGQKRTARRKKTVRKLSRRNEPISLDDLLKAKKLVFQMGGAKRARAAVDALAKLAD